MYNVLIYAYFFILKYVFSISFVNVYRYHHHRSLHVCSVIYLVSGYDGMSYERLMLYVLEVNMCGSIDTMYH